jgi:hypothetical protein
MADWQQVGRNWAKAGLADASISALIRKNHKALVMASLSPGGLNTMTNVSKNAASMGVQVGLSIPETLSAMSYAVEALDRGFIASSSRSLGRF